MPNIRPRRSLGQNFLVDPNTARKVVESLRAPPGSRVIEIGPGTGALTSLLHDRFPDMVAVEVDRRAVEYLSSSSPGLNVLEQDVLELDWHALAGEMPGRLFVIGNLPYHITSPILFRLLQSAPFISEAVLMMQLEVAQRLVARPRTKPYGILSVATQLVAHVELLFRVSPHVFRPRPKVTSAVIRLNFPEDGSAIEYTGTLRDVVRAAFNQRRKQLRNSLEGLVEEAGRDIPDRWSRRRAEELSPAEFVELARYLTPAS